MTEGIHISKHDRIQIIRLHRPEKKNALTTAMYGGITAAFNDGDADPDVAVHVILGAKGAFCAGNDIADFLSFAQGGGLPMQTTLAFLTKLATLEKPIIAGVDGVAVGVGVTMLMHCDLVYASPDSFFSTPFLDLGLVPEAASSLLMPRTFGYQRAFEMLVLGEPFAAHRARDCGLVNAIEPADILDAKTLEAAARLAQKPPEALKLARRLLRGDTAETLARINEEAALFSKRLGSPEAAEAFKAFLEKRPPDFSKAQVGG